MEKLCVAPDKLSSRTVGIFFFERVCLCRKKVLILHLGMQMAVWRQWVGTHVYNVWQRGLCRIDVAVKNESSKRKVSV